MFNHESYPHFQHKPAPMMAAFASPSAGAAPAPMTHGSAMMLLLASQSHLSAQQERPFSCPVPHCGGRFHRKFTLHEHMKTHTGEKPHACPIASCGKRFSTSGNLARHKRLHTLSKLKCPVTECTRIFTKKEKLVRHLKVHMGTTPHTCQVSDCSKTFSTAGNLTRHMKSQHPTVSIIKVAAPAAANASATPSSPAKAKAAMGNSLPDRIICREAHLDSDDYDHPHVQQHHLHAAQAPVTADGHLQDSYNSTSAPVATSENISDYEIMELLDSLFVEPVITTAVDCQQVNNNITAFMAPQQQLSSSVVYL
ncbi:Zinc finger protein 76 [Globisporangium polare]